VNALELCDELQVDVGTQDGDLEGSDNIRGIEISELGSVTSWKRIGTDVIASIRSMAA
jgi:hypothetical protein